MPWTFVHPAAVLPVRRCAADRHLFGALVVGSLSPDFGFYVGRFDMAALAHTTLGLVTVCLPTGLALAFLIRLLHMPVANLLPQPHRRALSALPKLPELDSPITLLYVSTAILVGAATHNIWDSFTHRTGYVVTHWQLLQMRAFAIGSRSFPVFELLQHASSVIGFIILAVVYIRWLHGQRRRISEPNSANDGWRYATLIFLAVISLGLSIPAAHAASATVGGAANITLLVVRIVILATSIFLVAVSLVALLVARRARM